MSLNVMRTHQRWLMIVISILVIISFLWFFSNRTQVDRMVSDKVGTIYGRGLTITELQRNVRELQTAADLGLRDLLAPEIFDERDLTSAAVNHLVVLHQAEAFGIAPTDDEVMDAEKQLPVFQTGGGFDSAKYAGFISDKLGPRGFSETQLDELVRQDIQVGKLRRIVDSPVIVTPLEVRTIYEQTFTKTDASVVRLPIAELAASIEPSEADIKKYYDQQNGSHQFQEPEKRRVHYVKFALNDEQKKLSGKARMDALQPLADQAAQFLEKLLGDKDKDAFAKLAATGNLPVKTTVDFQEDQRTGLEEASIPQFTASAFRLTPADPDSDVPLQTPDAFYVLRLDALTPERPLTLDEARAKIIAAIKDDRSRTALSARAEEVRTKIEQALKSGSAIADSATAAGLTAQDVPAFSASEPPRGVPDGSEISQASLELASGQLSKFIPTKDGGLLICIRGREPIDEGKFEQQRARLTVNLQERKRRLYFYEWMRASRDAAGVHLNNTARG